MAYFCRLFSVECLPTFHTGATASIAAAFLGLSIAVAIHFTHVDTDASGLLIDGGANLV